MTQKLITIINHRTNFNNEQSPLRRFKIGKNTQIVLLIDYFTQNSVLTLPNISSFQSVEYIKMQS